MNFHHKKSLGQHFLNSDYVPKQMCDAAGLSEPGTVTTHPASSDYGWEGLAGAAKERVSRVRRDGATPQTVLEIGPGTGILTREILARGAKVVAVEADERAISSLEESFADEIARGQLTIHHHDARTLDPAEFGLIKHSYICISNIPYYLSGSLFRSLLDTECQPSDLVFLVQKEVAERIARDQKESLLSLSVKAFGTPSYICTVKRGHFTPPPKVDSAIVAVREISRGNFSEISPTDFFRLLHLGFGQKRKQLLGNLTAEYPRDHLESVFNTTHIPLTIRAEDLPLATWLTLTKTLSKQ